MFPEIHAQHRQHAFLSADILATVPDLFATEHTAMLDKTVHVHYFSKNEHWWVFEYDQADKRAFGFSHRDDGSHVGMFDMQLLEAQRRGDGVVHRDLDWVARSAADAIPRNLHPSWWDAD